MTNLWLKIASKIRHLKKLLAISKLSHLKSEPSQSFGAWKSEPTQKLDTWSIFRRESRENSMVRILSHLKIFELKKSEPTQNLDTWSRFRRENIEKLNGSNFEPSQSYACTESRVIVSFDDFLSHLRYPPPLLTFQSVITSEILGSMSLYMLIKAFYAK